MKKVIDQSFKYFLIVLVLITLGITASVIFILSQEASGFFDQVGFFEFLFGTRWAPLLDPKSFGVLPLINGTMMIVLGSIAIALPAGI
ncbi:MAG: hypothetical protein R2827_13215 [Bdellovibrionales bacterium]